MYETDDFIDKCILVAVDDESGEIDSETSLNELDELLKTSGGINVGRLIQKRENRHPVHYLGKGKLEELKDLISLTGANGIICDDELSGVQQKNMSNVLDVKIMDRTMLILDIFAKHASTKEGKVQVELAQLKYNMSHLTGMGKQLSRLGGGIGTRGPGEKKLEIDRRTINERITFLNRELKEIEKHREILREKRLKNAIPVVALVGYTNAGKSTLMNAVSQAGVLAMDKLFATLDTTTRKVTLPNGREVVFSDTVGFIQKLPHGLIQAFKATLEELKYAHILVHVVDASSPYRDQQMNVVYSTLKSLTCMDKPVVTVFNKTDLMEYNPYPMDSKARATISLSALELVNIDIFLEKIENIINNSRQTLEIFVPYNESRVLSRIYDDCEVLSEEHKEEGTLVIIRCDERFTNILSKYMIN